MTAPETAEFLRGLPHFRLLAPELVDRLAEGCRRRALDGGERLFGEGDPCRAFFAVVTGYVKLVRIGPAGHEQVLHRLRAGQTFAEAALLSFGVFPATAVAVEQTELLEIRGEPFLDLLREDGRLAAAMIGSLCAWVGALATRVEDLSVDSAGARLARYLLRLPAHGPADRPEVVLPTSKRELAAQLSVTPETLSRLLRRWKDRGLLEESRRRLVVRDPELLTTIADRLERA